MRRALVLAAAIAVASTPPPRRVRRCRNRIFSIAMLVFGSAASAARAPSPSASVLVSSLVSLDADVPTQHQQNPPEQQLQDTFHSAADLGEWHDYFESVYGVETMRFPFSLADLNFFYEDRLPAGVRASLRVRGGADVSRWGESSPLLRGQLYRLFSSSHIFRCPLDVCSTDGVDSLCAANGFAGGGCPRGREDSRSARIHKAATAALRLRGRAERALHSRRPHGLVRSLALDPMPNPMLRPSVNSLAAEPMLQAGAPNNSLVEVIHTGGDPPNMGVWFYYARGSGIYLNVSRSLAFEQHADSFAFFHCGNEGQCPDPGSEAKTSGEAAREGWDTLQYTRFRELGLVKSEIVFNWLNTRDDRFDTNGVCPLGNASVAHRFLRRGFGGVKPCECHRVQDDLAC